MCAQRHPGPARQLPRSVCRKEIWRHFAASFARLRACAEQSSPISRCPHPLLPRRWCPAPCAPATWPVVCAPKLQRHPLSPPGCLRTRIGIPPSLCDGVNRGLRDDRPAEHAFRRANLSDDACCIVSHAVGRSRPSAGGPSNDRSLRGVRRRSDGKATTLRSSRAGVAVSRAVGASVRLCSCADRP